MKKIIRNSIIAIILCIGLPSGFALPEEEKDLNAEVGQMIMAGFRGTDLSESPAIVRAIQDIGLGGVILFDIDVPSGRTFPRNIINADQTKKLTADLRKVSRIPLFISVDAEGGRVNRLKPKYGFKDIPGAGEVGGKNDEAYTREVADALASEVAGLGFNMNFAPVVDVNIRPDNPVIGGIGRAFSSDPVIVANNAAIYIESARNKNVISVLKHFPGHGSSSQDSHLGLVDVTESYKKEELVPYEILIGKGDVDCIMTAHIMDRSIDADYPATLSPKFLRDILRQKLHYEGVVISDDMHMGAIVDHYGLAEAVVLAVNAGCDIILASNNGKEYDELLPYKIRDAIVRGVKDGRIPRERIREASGRIAKLKNKYMGSPAQR